MLPHDNMFRCFLKGSPTPQLHVSCWGRGGKPMNPISREFTCSDFSVELAFFLFRRKGCICTTYTHTSGWSEPEKEWERGMDDPSKSNSYAIWRPSGPLAAMRSYRATRWWAASSTHGWEHSLAVSHRKDVTLCRIISPIGFLWAAQPGSVYEQSCDRARAQIAIAPF